MTTKGHLTFKFLWTSSSQMMISHRPVGSLILDSHLGTISNPEGVFFVNGLICSVRPQHSLF